VLATRPLCVAIALSRFEVHEI